MRDASGGSFLRADSGLTLSGPVWEFNRFDDIDPDETEEWLESIDSVLRSSGATRAHYLLN